MTLLHWDNMGDTYDTATGSQRGWTGFPGSITIVPGRVSGNACKLAGGTVITPDSLSKNVTLGTEFTRHIAVKTEQTNSSDLVLVSFNEGSTNHIQLCLTATTRLLRIKRNGTTVVTGTHALTVGTWHQVVIHVKVGDAGTGECHVWLDEVADIADTTSDFKNGGTGVIDNFILHGTVGNPIVYDDLHDWSGNDDHGNSRVLGRVAVPDATAAGTYSDWTPLSGTDHGAMVDDNPPDDDTTYVYTDTPGNRDSYRLQPLGIPSTATIHAMGITAIARKLDIGTRLVALFARTNATDFDGADQAPDFDYNAMQEAWEVNPDTTAAWTVAEVDAVEAGILDGT